MEGAILCFEEGTKETVKSLKSRSWESITVTETHDSTINRIDDNTLSSSMSHQELLSVRVAITYNSDLANDGLGHCLIAQLFSEDRDQEVTIVVVVVMDLL